MILKSVFTGSELDNYRGIEKTLREMGLNVSRFEALDSDVLFAKSRKLTQRADKMMSESRPHDCVRDRNYVIARLGARALRYLAEHKEKQDSSEEAVPGMTYYKNVTESDGVVTGYRCTYLGEDRKGFHNWVPFSDKSAKLKIMEVLRHGTDEDFTKIYVDLADGRPVLAASKFTVEHITESSDSAIAEMEAYCDSRWDGEWPWQRAVTPKHLKDTIRENAEMRKERLREMREEFNSLHREVYEGEIEQSEVILKGREIIQDITDMIHKLGKISAESMTSLKDQARTEFGDSVAGGLEQVSNEHVSSAVDALGTLKAAIDGKLREMESQLGADPLGSDLDDIDAMYGDGEGGDDIDPDDVDGGDDLDIDPEELEPDTGEREKK